MMQIQANKGVQFEVLPPAPPNHGLLFVDHAKAGRSGHLGHALVEYEPGRILAFYSNCSAARGGHSADGWMEYKRSEDGGRTWSAPMVLDYSKHAYEQGKQRAVMCEKAVATPDGTIVLFTLECDITESVTWEPYLVPSVLRSSDGGRTWGRPKPLGDHPGRVYDVLYHNDCILALEFCNDGSDRFDGTRDEHVYRLYASTDGGESFALRSILPFDTRGRAYGTMAVLHDASLVAYVYNINDEQHADYLISRDAGVTWGSVQRTFLEKQIRNPQMAAFKDGFVLHGRSGSQGDHAIRGHFVLYTSDDGLTWDAGRFLRMRDVSLAGKGAYSNNLLVSTPEAPARERLLIQASHAYDQGMTNVVHWWLE